MKLFRSLSVFGVIMASMLVFTALFSFASLDYESGGDPIEIYFEEPTVTPDEPTPTPDEPTPTPDEPTPTPDEPTPTPQDPTEGDEPTPPATGDGAAPAVAAIALFSLSGAIAVWAYIGKKQKQS